MIPRGFVPDEEMDGDRAAAAGVLFKAAGSMVPEPSIMSPPIPFIGAEVEWEVPYIASPGRTGKVEGRRKADRASVSTPRSQNAGW